MANTQIAFAFTADAGIVGKGVAAQGPEPQFELLAAMALALTPEQRGMLENWVECFASEEESIALQLLGRAINERDALPQGEQ